MPFPRHGTTRRCRAKAKSTGQQCRSPAAYGCATCRMHGARKRESIKSGAAHPRFLHGQETIDARASSRENGKLMKQVKAALKKTGDL